MVGARVEARGLYLRQIDGVAVNGESPASDYSRAVDWQEV